MEGTPFENRIRLLIALSVVAVLVLVGRLWQLQLTQWVDYAQAATANRTQIVWEPAPRGIILDRRGRVLAKNMSRWELELVPADFPARDLARREEIVRMLAGILDLPTPQVREEIAEALKQGALESVPLPNLGGSVDLEIVAQVEARRPELPGIRIASRARRFYPQGKLASHLLGYVRPISPERHAEQRNHEYPAGVYGQRPPWPLRDQVYDLSALVGQVGVERLFESTEREGQVIPVLQGRRGYRLYQVRATGEPNWLIQERAPAAGATVILTLDAQLQRITEQALDNTLSRRGQAGAAVMLDVNTGEVLVMASRPAVDANQWVKGFSPEEWERLQNHPGDPLINHVIGGCYPPGSIFKPVSAAAALSTTEIKLTDHSVCRGMIHEGRDRTPFRCWNRSPGHGPVGFFQGMAQSCDIYYYDLVRRHGLSSDSLAEYSRRFGLGTLSGLGLTGERPGFVPTRQWKQEEKQEPWTTGNTLHFVIGQGYLTTTPLQMALVTAAVANGGTLLVPRLASQIVWPDWLGYGTQKITESGHRQVGVDPEVLQTIRRAMRLTVTDGTARVMDGMGVPVAGKTGSAQHRLDRTTHAWFVAYAPAENPRYAVCVFVEEGGHGGAVAAPVARRMLAAALNLPEGQAPPAPASD